MDGKIWFRIVAGLVLIAAVVGIAFFAFNAGVATHVQLPANGSGQPLYPYFGFWPAFPFFGLGCFGPLIALLLLFVALRAISFIFWGPRWAHWGHMHKAHYWHHRGWDEEDVPPMFQEWHDRVHGKTETDNKDK